MATNRNLEHLHRLVGTWTSTLVHRLMPGEVIRGTTTFEWLAGERFLVMKSCGEHPAIPEAMSIIGVTDQDRVGAESDADAGAPLTMHYYDSRGVFRAFEFRIDAAGWEYSRLAPGFSQRFRGTFADGGETTQGVVQLCENDRDWVDDLTITYRRVRAPA